MSSAKPQTKWSYQIIHIMAPLVRETPTIKPLRSPGEAYELCKDMSELPTEAFHVILLNGKNNVIDRVQTGGGILDACLVTPREVFRNAVHENAAAIVLIHNHPSGDATPSSEDIRITKQLIKSGKVLGIQVADHVIVGRPAEGRQPYLSMRETGIVSFTE